MAKDKDDLQADANLKRLDGLEDFRKQYEGKAFEEKVANAIKDSRLVETEVKKIAWATIREKIIWIILGGLAVIFTDLIVRAIPNLLQAIGH